MTVNLPPRTPKPQIGFFRGKQSSLTRRIIWHGSTAFLIGGFVWATYATIQNENGWKEKDQQKLKEYERLVAEYRQTFEFEGDAKDANTNGAH